MKILVLLLSAGLLLSACTLGNKSTDGQTGTDSVIQKQTQNGLEAKLGDTVAVDYVGKFEDGTVFDSSIESEAKKAPNFSAGRTYEPLITVLEEGGGTISGFWKGIVGMKVGETKSVKIAPEDAYGAEWIDNGESTVDKSIFDDILVRTIPKSQTLDAVPMSVPRENLEQEGGTLPKVGDTIESDRGTKAKVVSIDDKNVHLTIDNSANPFHGKKIAVGTKINFEDGNVGTITKVSKDEVTLNVKNNANPFAGKKLEVGLEGDYMGAQRVKITKIEDKMVTVALKTKNTHSLANKTLVFELTLKEIK